MRGFAESGANMFRRISPPLATAVLLGTLLMPLGAGASSSTAVSSGSTGSGPPAGAVAAPLTATTATAVNNLGNGTSDISFTNGQSITVPTSVASKVTIHSGVSPDNTVYGNCGDSYLYIEKNGNTGVWGYTGYDVTPSFIGAVYYFEWEVHSENTTYSRGQTNDWDGPTSADSWIQEFYDNDGAGAYESSVIYGYVFGTNTVCYSGDPSSRITTP